MGAPPLPAEVMTKAPSGITEEHIHIPPKEATGPVRQAVKSSQSLLLLQDTPILLDPATHFPPVQESQGRQSVLLLQLAPGGALISPKNVPGTKLPMAPAEAIPAKKSPPPPVAKDCI